MVRRALIVLLLLTPAGVHAQRPATQSDGTTNVEVDPIRCWWRTSAGAVRVGEVFDLSLTCAVLENDAVQVMPDESRLGAGVIAMAPFEVVGGSHPADLHSGSRRFFQYLYTLRLINADAIGKDVAIPDVMIHYRVNSKIAQNTALQGRDLVYVLPPLSIRVASMVPSDAPDIRDAAGEPFTTAEGLDFRAGVLEIVALALIALGSLMTLLLLVRVARGSRQRTPADQRQLGPWTVAGVAVRELADVQREREQQGWTPALADRAVAATRVAAAGALGRPISQRVAEASTPAGEGRLLARGPRRGTRRVISAAVTAGDLSRELARVEPGAANAALLERLRTALAAFTAAGYSRTIADPAAKGGTQPGSGPDLDAALTSALESAREVRSLRAWPRRMLRRRPAARAVMEPQA